MPAKPWLQEPWCIPAGPSGAFVPAMGDVIAVYHRPADPRRPGVCLDEQPVRLIGETRTPLPARPGHPRRSDDEYRRNGTANRFPAFAPRVGWRHVPVTDRRPAKGVGAFPRHVVDEVYAAAEMAVLVTDNLNVHGVGSRYEAFAPRDRPADRGGGRVARHPEARELAGRGRVRIRSADPPVPDPSHRDDGRTAGTGRGVGERPERATGRGQVAVHDRRRPDQASPPLPVHSRGADH